MNIIEKQIVKSYHLQRMSQQAITPAEAQGWTSKLVQDARFNAIIGLADFNDASVLDIGCGYGDFKARLDQEFNQVKYIGIDQQQEFISRAKVKYREDENAVFYEADINLCQLPMADLVVASGALSYYSANPDYYEKTILKLFKAAKRVLIFNMLDNKVFQSGELIVAHNREAIYRKCRKICSQTTLKTGYLKEDFTIKMEK